MFMQYYGSYSKIGHIDYMAANNKPTGEIRKDVNQNHSEGGCA